MAHFPPSDTMTSMTPPSFVDDGQSFPRRIPRSIDRWNIDKWLASTTAAPSTLSTTDTSAYTGSYVDDGADMLVVDQTTMGPGFGKINKTFYIKAKQVEDEVAWTEDMAKAVGGDIWTSLREMRGLADVEVVDGVDDQRGGKSKEKERRVGQVDEDGGVWVKMPLTWGAFVIEEEDGRVVVVEKDGEYDSGCLVDVVVDLGRSQKEKEEGRRRKKDEKKKKKKKKRGEVELAKQYEKTVIGLDDKGLEKERHRRSSSLVTKPPTPIAKAGTWDNESNVASDAVSPTKFFMSGGASGWPSPIPSPVKPLASPTRSPPGAWPSPELSPVKQSSEVAWNRGSPVASAPASVVETVDTWKEETWEASGSTTKQPSVAGSLGSRSTKSSQGSATPSKDTGGEEKLDNWDRDPSDQAVCSHTKSVAFDLGYDGKNSWKRDVEEFQSHTSPTTVVAWAPSTVRLSLVRDEPVATYSTRSRASSQSDRTRALSTTDTAIVDQTWDQYTTSGTSSSPSSRKTSISRQTPSCSTWNAPATEPETRSTRSRSSPEPAADGSPVSTVQPYSWRREVEEQSICSTNGSSGSRTVPGSVTGSSTWQEDGEDKGTWKQDMDTRSVRSTHSTYHHPTVEDAPPTPVEEMQEWDTQAASESRWGDQGGDAGGDKSAGWNDDQHGGHGSGGSERDKSGYGEDNQTWLNTEVGGVRYREAEWRRPGAISWRDV